MQRAEPLQRCVVEEEVQGAGVEAEQLQLLNCCLGLRLGLSRSKCDGVSCCLDRRGESSRGHGNRARCWGGDGGIEVSCGGGAN